MFNYYSMVVNETYDIVVDIRVREPNDRSFARGLYSIIIMNKGRLLL